MTCHTCIQVNELCPESHVRRVHELASDLGTTSQMVLKLAGELGLFLRSASSKVVPSIERDLVTAWTEQSGEDRDRMAAAVEAARQRRDEREAEQAEADRLAAANTDIRLRDVVDVNTAAALAGVKPNTIRQWERRGALKRLPGSGRVTYPAYQVQAASAATETAARRINKDQARKAQSPEDAITLLEIAITEALAHGIDVLPHVKRILGDRWQDRFR